MHPVDETDPFTRVRRVRTVNGRRLHRARWYREPAPTRILQKNKYRNERSDNYDLRSWTQPKRWFGTRILKNANRKKH